MTFLHMVKFNYLRLFKHWSAYVLYGMVIALVVGIGLFPHLHSGTAQPFTAYTNSDGRAPNYIGQDQEMPMLVQMIIIFAPYLFALLFGTMIFIAVSVESIEKISYLLLSKVSAFHILYSKVVAVLLFFMGLLTLGILGFLTLAAIGVIHPLELIHASHLNMGFGWRYGTAFILGILQIVMLFTLFALFIRESSQLQTGMMIPGIITAVGWGVGYWMLLFKPNLLAHPFLTTSLQGIPIFNLFATIARLGSCSLTNLDLAVFIVATVLWLALAHFSLRIVYAANQKINL
ncbi:hypothetical protein [Saccharibacillus kuerlensis]|uniref:ABC transporter permease n=1 Tax=Saccharibacillus kuerlensis TaxID=459527 RepID=A0ABQ2L1K4_9BACL|nr:hypothetical protein [Saccharibacillus kuerlensis]GGN99626.1 hypothetical protein GCM10010969_19870 [Saccharibacillus kuerlensis]